MIANTRVSVLTGFLLVLCQLAAAQPSFISFPDTSSDTIDSFKPPKNRELFHDYIDKEQKNILKSDGKGDDLFTPSSNDEVNLRLTNAATKRINWLQYKIEKDSSLSPQNKVRYLRGVENVLKLFNSNIRMKKVNPVLLPDIITAFEDCMENDKEGRSIEPIIKSLPYEVALSIAKTDRVTFEKTKGTGHPSI